MFKSIFKDLIYQIKKGDIWTRIIIICSIVFLFVNLFKSYFLFTSNGASLTEYHKLLNYFTLSSSISDNLWYPWVWFTHIFIHEGFGHLLWNMIFLYWVSSIVVDFIGKRHAIYIFFEGALLGAVFFLISVNFIPFYNGINSHAFGASAAVTALLFAASTISPDYNIRLILIGNVPLKYIAGVVLLLDLLFASQNINTGGHFAHIGGAIMGWSYIKLLREGVNMDFLNLQNSIKKNRPSVVKTRKVNFKAEKKMESEQEKTDRILEKIKNKGIASLSTEEKSFLDQMSK